MTQVTNDTLWAPDWPRLVHFQPFEPARTALLVVDMQVYAADPDGNWGRVLRDRYPKLAAYYFPQLANVVIPNLRRLLDFFRAAGIRVIYLTVGPTLQDGSDYLAARFRRDEVTGVCTLPIVGTPQHAIISSVAPQPGELVINKTSDSPFNSTAIDLHLRTLGINNLVVTGLITNSCVEITARDAVDRGFGCAIVSDACATFDADSHKSSLLAFERVAGRVVSTSQIIEELSVDTRD